MWGIPKLSCGADRRRGGDGWQVRPFSLLIEAGMRGVGCESIIGTVQKKKKHSRKPDWTLTDDSDCTQLKTNHLCPSSWTCWRGSEVSSLRVLVMVSDYWALRFWLDRFQIVAFSVLFYIFAPQFSLLWCKISHHLGFIRFLGGIHWNSEFQYPTPNRCSKKQYQQAWLGVSNETFILCFAWFEIWVTVSFKCSLDWNT